MAERTANVGMKAGVRAARWRACCRWQFLAWSLAALCLAVWPARAAQPAQSDPRAVATRFYRTYLRLKIMGLPNAGQMRALSPLLCPELRSRFAAARRAQDKAVKAHPDEKPPYGDGTSSPVCSRERNCPGSGIHA